MIIRAFQSSQIPWAFRPPGQAIFEGTDQQGIWLMQSGESIIEEEVDQDREETEASSSSDGAECAKRASVESGSEIESENAQPVIASAHLSSAFGALSVESESEKGEEGEGLE